MFKNTIFDSGMKKTKTYFLGIVLVIISALFNQILLIAVSLPVGIYPFYHQIF